MNPKDSTLKVPSIHANSRLKRCSTVLLYTYCTCTFVPFIDKSFVAYSTCTRTCSTEILLYLCTKVVLNAQLYMQPYISLQVRTYMCVYTQPCTFVRRYNESLSSQLREHVPSHSSIFEDIFVPSYFRTFVRKYNPNQEPHTKYCTCSCNHRRYVVVLRTFEGSYVRSLVKYESTKVLSQLASQATSTERMRGDAGWSVGVSSSI